MPSRCTGRASGAMNVYSIVPSQRSQATVSVRISKRIPRYAQITETVAWERWEGTIEYTFMAPLARPVHLLGMGAFAVVYGLLRTILLFGVVSAFLDVHY